MIKFYFDFHDIFVDSRSAWLNALEELGAPLESYEAYNRGVSRHIICKRYGIDYNVLENTYRRLLKPIEKNIIFAQKLSQRVNISLLSAANKRRLYMDLQKFNLDSLFEKIYSKEDFITKHEFLVDKSKAYDWVVYFNHSSHDIRQDGNIVEIPIDFDVDKTLVAGESFDEHAKSKLLYNELSDYYMHSITNDTKAEIEFINKIMNKDGSNVRYILDCCCGVGRHSYELAKCGYNVYGIDFSTRQIENACALHGHPNVNYKVMDVRNFAINKIFDAAICMWTTYNYLSINEELKMFAKNVWNHLNENGIFILDAKNIPALENKRVYTRSDNTEDGIQIDLLINKKITGCVQDSQYLYFITKNSDEKIFYLDNEHVRYYSLEELCNIIGDFFEVVGVYGDFNGNKYDTTRSERFITVLKKRKI